MTKKRFVFLTSIKWRPSMNKLEVIKETAKMLKLGEEINILGSKTWSSQIHKENQRYFDDPTEAIEWLLVEQAKVIQQKEIELDDAHDDRELLEKLLKEMRKDELD